MDLIFIFLEELERIFLSKKFPSFKKKKKTASGEKVFNNSPLNTIFAVGFA